MQSVEQLRDRLAEAMGWNCRFGFYDTTTGPHTQKWHKGSDEQFGHPVTLSLDWLAAHGLPEGWKWAEIGVNALGWYSFAGTDGGIGVVECDYPTELHARLAACVAAWHAQAERSGT